jgi:hypothetical protein
VEAVEVVEEVAEEGSKVQQLLAESLATFP